MKAAKRRPSAARAARVSGEASSKPSESLLPDGDLTADGEAEIIAALSARASRLQPAESGLAVSLAIPQFKGLVAWYRWRTAEAARTAAAEAEIERAHECLSRLSVALDEALEAARVAADVLHVMLPSHRQWLDEWAFQTGALQAIAEHAGTKTQARRLRTRGPAVDTLRQDLEGAVADVLCLIGVPLTKYRNGTLARCLRVVYRAATGLAWPSDPKDVLTRLLDVEQRSDSKWSFLIDKDGTLTGRRRE
jgi:hypothetical protein